MKNDSSNLHLEFGQIGSVLQTPMKFNFCQTPDLGQGLEFDFTFAMEQVQ